VIVASGHQKGRREKKKRNNDHLAAVYDIVGKKNKVGI